METPSLRYLPRKQTMLIYNQQAIDSRVIVSQVQKKQARLTTMRVKRQNQ
ncbi:Hypothetical predicted protein [Paramuricea clavata]|uniref:Uncharacterized protein n=1 Tax=Paramuricea clavata TaxID=317549 RepID=A0A7D9JTJ8_PARCT|nr:Hypothetical predicted protein [Paramuricea clavata]